MPIRPTDIVFVAVVSAQEVLVARARVGVTVRLGSFGMARACAVVPMAWNKAPAIRVSPAPATLRLVCHWCWRERMRLRTFLVATALFGTISATLAQAQDRPRTIKVSSAGPILTDARGMTLYSFSYDAPGKSNCYGKCEKAWPPLHAKRGDKAIGQYSIIRRKDGSRQWAVRGMPLYYWSKDQAPYDTTGEGVNGAWHVVVAY